MTDIIVSICCITYNHEKFIRDAIEGFLMQKTTFNFEILINDDASTDNTQQIIREYETKYPELIFPIYHKENQWSKGVKPNQAFNFPRARGKYIAMCEGDDYWTDTMKLQKQVEFMDENLEYSFCFTRFKTFDSTKNITENDKNEHYFNNSSNGVEFDFEKFYKGWHLGTQTIMLRKASISYQNFNNEYYRDVFLITDLLNVGKGFCLKDFTAIYRIHQGGIHNSKNNFEKTQIAAKVYSEIYLNNKHNIYLLKKFIKFSNDYILNLLVQKKFKNVYIELNHRSQKFDQFKYKIWSLISLFKLLIIRMIRISKK